MAQIGDVPAPPCTIETPENLVATGGKRSVKLSWDAATDAEGYNVYYSQNGKYTFIDSTSGTSFTDRRLTRGQVYTYVVTAFRTCPAGGEIESGYSNEASASPR
jgi:fibronectin type 3 domain-containing protein